MLRLFLFLVFALMGWTSTAAAAVVDIQTVAVIDNTNILFSSAVPGNPGDAVTLRLHFYLPIDQTPFAGGYTVYEFRDGLSFTTVRLFSEDGTRFRARPCHYGPTASSDLTRRSGVSITRRSETTTSRSTARSFLRARTSMA